MLETLFQDPTQRVLSKYNSQLTQINRLGASFKNFTDQELREHTSKLKQQLLASDNNKESITNEAFALVREASTRVLGLRHYDVQLIGGLVLN